MNPLIAKLQTDYPDLVFKSAKQFYWSPETNEIFYNASPAKYASWSLLHESGHALLKHLNYQTDFGLLKLEVAAWEKAKELAKDYKIKIDEEHIQDCLDTYRNWLYKRSICPNCTSKCLQLGDIVHYRCFNCHTTWKVSANRFCRAYRTTSNVIQTPVTTLSSVLE